MRRLFHSAGRFVFALFEFAKKIDQLSRQWISVAISIPKTFANLCAHSIETRRRGFLWTFIGHSHSVAVNIEPADRDARSIQFNGIGSRQAALAAFKCSVFLLRSRMRLNRFDARLFPALWAWE
jgi:hypothetical protein